MRVGYPAPIATPSTAACGAVARRGSCTGELRPGIRSVGV